MIDVGGSKFCRVQVFNLSMSINGQQWDNVGSFLSLKGARSVRDAMQAAGVESSKGPEFEIKMGDSLLMPERIAELRRQGFKVKVLK